MTKIILHLDMNSYYASLEQQAYPNLRGKPLGIAGKGRGERTVVAGASIEAKKRGVRGAMSTWEAQRICPEIIIIPANYDRYIYISQKIFGLLERFSSKVEVFSIDEAFIELPNGASWADGVAISKQIKQLITTQIGEWVKCSIGLSYGRTLAKLASELQKPDGLVVIRPDNFPEIAEKTPIESLCGIGYRIRPRLNQLGVETLADLRLIPKDILVKMFGDFTGQWLYQISHGHDDNKLHSFHDLSQEKSIGHSYTVPRDLTSLEDAKKVALLLCERVGIRLRRKRLIGRTISLYLRFNDRTGWGERYSQKEFIFDGLGIYEMAEQLFARLLHEKPIRLISVSLSDLVKQVEVTRPLFEPASRAERLVKTIDRINDRYGEFTVHRAMLTNLKQRIFRLPDGRNKRLYVPTISPFMKRLSP